MKSFLIYIVMAFLSLFIFGFGAWTYNQSIYEDKVRKYFLEKNITPIKDLKTVANLSDKMVLIQGEVVADQTFISKDNKKVVLERYEEETKNLNNNWKIVKDSPFFKALPFKIKDKENNTVLIDPYDIDKSFLSNPREEIKKENGQEIKKSYWSFLPNQKLYILGNMDNKSGVMVINSPNLYKSVSSLQREPFIVSSLEKTEVITKAMKIGKSIYYASMALFAAGIFFVISSISNIAKNYKKISNNFI